MRSVKHGGKKGMRYRYKLSAVKRQNKKQKMLRKTGCEIIDQAWDKKMTTRQNLGAMGFAYDPNDAIGMSTQMEVDEFDLNQARSLGCMKTQIVCKKNSIGANCQNKKVVRELEKIKQISQPKRNICKAKLLKEDIEFCKKMIEIHGENYEAMHRDSLNIWQKTPQQIKCKIELFKRNA